MNAPATKERRESPPPAQSSPYFDAWKKSSRRERVETARRDAERIRELNASIAERSKFLTQTARTRADELAEQRARIKALERALASAERKLARARSEVKSLRTARVSCLTETLSALSTRTPRVASEIHQKVCQSYGQVTIRNVHKALAALLEDGAARRTAEGYLMVPR